MKKIICVLMCLSLCLCLFGCGEGTSEEKSSPLSQNEIKGKDVTGKVGDVVNVIFEIGKNTPVAAADFLIEYDSNVLEYVETKQIYAFKDGYITGNSVSAGVVKAAIVTLTPPTDGGDLFSINFKLLKEFKEGSEVKIKCTSCCDENFTKFELSCKSAKVFSK